ncbi:MAG: GntR family transcriptional regulator [Anaerolineae bacterium]|nr:GntR family transcriptional regulator [Anaerolineae bacterium]
MLDAHSVKPLYEQIKDHILRAIEKGVYEAGSRIPSERALSEKYGVNRMTVKKALDELVQMGYLDVRIGKGTYVSRPKIDQQLTALTSFTEDMAKRGQSASSRVLVAGYVPADVQEARILNIDPMTPLVFLIRVRLADDTPIAVERTKIIASYCHQIVEMYDFTRDSLYGVLRNVYGVHLAYAEQSIEARRATAEEAKLLQIEIGEPILQITRVTFSDGDKPIEYVRSAYCGARYKFQALLRNL